MPFKFLTQTPVHLPDAQHVPDNAVILVHRWDLAGIQAALNYALREKGVAYWRYTPGEPVVPLDVRKLKARRDELKRALRLRDRLSGLSACQERVQHYVGLGLERAALYGAVSGETGLSMREVQDAHELLVPVPECLPRALMSGRLPFSARSLASAIQVHLETGDLCKLTSMPSMPGRWGAEAVSKPLVREGRVEAAPAGVSWNEFLWQHAESIGESDEVREEDVLNGPEAVWDPEFRDGVRFDGPEEYLNWWVPAWLEAHYLPLLKAEVEARVKGEVRGRLLFALHMEARSGRVRHFMDEGVAEKRARIDRDYGGYQELLDEVKLGDLGLGEIKRPTASHALARDIWIEELKLQI